MPFKFTCCPQSKKRSELANVTASLFIHTSQTSVTNGIISFFQNLSGFDKTSCTVSAPLQLPNLLNLLGRKQVMVSAKQMIPQFECNNLHMKKEREKKKSTLAEEALKRFFLTDFRSTQF